ncbi:Asp-tRNA(Asn)/Glu-tRNA(Gln) amidotransferase subunit GatA [Rickettsia endosymbiont of Cardiosporidium cionae]|uniref:Asp-tRNA(Asn)/Glu-tRNA(Gln) amidotransferase subunit GatA n=1 Tax=Rickettsia endosymbiont of Cardiosporidium cionae TaxID=2777155 RepID=UPI0018931709|nr:Asp-tRNA(Asn)/Glu-tRNA(Gln) amidotransferase subunit GatA [Rickettsia endosymbiont of Cardiosporidium cionae]KAF8818323.1 Asp-tRNA(Asn)/Glu-tRNA(Gln) amidotransferase subunit GatA [Rickettsia endosymbiont of Cardiosporidium cionae]
MSELTKLSIVETLKKLKNKDFSVKELITAHIEQISKHKPLNCYITTNFEQALLQAEKSDQRYLSNSARKLEGIAIAVKDVFCTKGIRTTAGSKMLDNFVPTYESTVSNKILSEGSIILGKANMDEFSMGSSNTNSYFGATLNPWKEKGSSIDLVPGGSSGGSAAAVSSFQAMAALGGDTGGSIRQPASFTGTVGIKPTYGRCSRWGMIAFASSLDQAGIFTRNVKDAAITLETIMGYDPKDSTSSQNTIPNLQSVCDLSIKNTKIGIPINIMENQDINPEIKTIWKNSISILKNAGAQIVEITLPYIEHALPTYYVIASAEASSNLARYDSIRYGYRINNTDGLKLEDISIRSRTEAFGEEVKRRILIGTYVLSANRMNTYYIKAQKIRNLISCDFQNAFKKVEAILMPATPNSAFPVTQTADPTTAYLNDIFTTAPSLSGLPCLSVPAGLTNSGLPLGIQIISQYFREDNLIKLAYNIEKSININFVPEGY